MSQVFRISDAAAAALIYLAVVFHTILSFFPNYPVFVEALLLSVIVNYVLVIQKQDGNICRVLQF
jgi:hypothetical protein